MMKQLVLLPVAPVRFTVWVMDKVAQDVDHRLNSPQARMQRLREIDRRMRFLRKRMEIAEVVDPTRQMNRERVYFGATVVYRNARDEEKTVRIVGIDEARSECNEVSWISPVAKALLNRLV